VSHRRARAKQARLRPGPQQPASEANRVISHLLQLSRQGPDACVQTCNVKLSEWSGRQALQHTPELQAPGPPAREGREPGCRAGAQVVEDLADAVGQVKALQEAVERAHDSRDGAPDKVDVPADVAALADWSPRGRRAGAPPAGNWFCVASAGRLVPSGARAAPSGRARHRLPEQPRRPALAPALFVTRRRGARRRRGQRGRPGEQRAAAVVPGRRAARAPRVPPRRGARARRGRRRGAAGAPGVRQRPPPAGHAAAARHHPGGARARRRVAEPRAAAAATAGATRRRRRAGGALAGAHAVMRAALPVCAGGSARERAWPPRPSSSRHTCWRPGCARCGKRGGPVGVAACLYLYPARDRPCQGREGPECLGRSPGRPRVGCRARSVYVHCLVLARVLQGFACLGRAAVSCSACLTNKRAELRALSGASLPWVLTAAFTARLSSCGACPSHNGRVQQAGRSSPAAPPPRNQQPGTRTGTCSTSCKGQLWRPSAHSQEHHQLRSLSLCYTATSRWS